MLSRCGEQPRGSKPVILTCRAPAGLSGARFVMISTGKNRQAAIFRFDLKQACSFRSRWGGGVYLEFAKQWRSQRARSDRIVDAALRVLSNKH